jgi:hypothetical protein
MKDLGKFFTLFPYNEEPSIIHEYLEENLKEFHEDGKRDRFGGNCIACSEVSLYVITS